VWHTILTIAAFRGYFTQFMPKKEASTQGK